MNAGQVGFIKGYTHRLRVAALLHAVKPGSD
jgi:hypothetical protein